jgi:hypothetical protein
MEFQLWYGDGFFGRDYYLMIDTTSFKLSERAPPGGPADEKLARENAISILSREAPHFVEEAKVAKFKWDGTL